MILKASQRGGGQDLAGHLLRTDENDHIRIHELRGFASDDLKGAFKEAEAVSRGTKCVEYLFSCSFNPPEDADVSVAQFEASIERAEKKLGLEGQPRAIVFHEKEGRRHAHCVWSRIDAETMTARQMSFFKLKLTDLSRDLYLEHGWQMPNGLAHSGGRDPTNFSLAEWQLAKRLGQDPRWIKGMIQGCWNTSDDARSFRSALEQHSFFLAKGDKRSFVVLGHDGDVHSLPRALGLKAKEVGARLGKSDELPSVADTQASIGRRMTPAIRRHVEDSRTRFQQSLATLCYHKMEMTHRQRDQRSKLHERLDREWQEATSDRAWRLPTGFKSLWQRLTGQYRKIRVAHQAEADAMRDAQDAERAKLSIAQQAERLLLQEEFKELRTRQAAQLQDLRKEVGRYLSFTRCHEQRADHLHSLGSSLALRGIGDSPR